MRSSVLLCLFLCSISIVWANVGQKLPDGRLAYYGADFYRTKVTKSLLFKILNESHLVVEGRPDLIATDCQGTCYRHNSVGYEGARKIIFGELYKLEDRSGRTYVQDVYCGKKFYFRSVNDITSMHSEVNVEHTWPQSKFNGNFDKNMQKSDLHHLYPTDSDANNRRANHQFGETGDHHNELNVQDCNGSQLADISGHFIFTPPEKHRGNVARSLFYFATRYNLSIGHSEEIILRQWHKLDPVDEAERSRHEIIANYQKVRNPFIDHPELVEKVQDF